MSLAAQKIRETESPRSYQTSAPNVDVQYAPRKRITKGEKVLWVLGLITILVLCISIVSNAASLYNKSKQVSQLQGEISQMTDVNTGLNTQIAKLSAPQRIIQYAETQLGMTLNVNNVKVVK